MRGRGVGADTGWSVTSGKAVSVAADGGDSGGALAASGGVVCLILWSGTGCVTDSCSSTGWGGRSTRVGDGKPSSKETISLDSTTTRLSGPKPYNHLNTYSLCRQASSNVRLDNDAQHSECAQIRSVRVPGFDYLTLASASCCARMSLRCTLLPMRFRGGPNGAAWQPNRTFSDSIRLWAVSYRRVELNSFLLTNLPQLSHTQLARVVPHDFAHPFLGLNFCGDFEYFEGF